MNINYVLIKIVIRLFILCSLMVYCNDPQPAKAKPANPNEKEVKIPHGEDPDGKNVRSQTGCNF